MMNKELVIFGTGQIGELAHYYFQSDSDHDVSAFVVDPEYITDSHFCGLPVVPTEEMQQRFPPDRYAAFAALSYARLNAVRKEKFEALKAMGYKLTSYVSSKASVLNQGKIGENCFVLEDNTIQPFTRIGNNVTLWSGNHIGHHSIIHDHVFVASHVVVSGGVEIEEQTFIGVNATLRDHIRVGARCVIGAGALLLANALPETVYIGAATEVSRVPSTRLRKI